MIKDEIYIIGNSYSCLMTAALITKKKVNLISDYNFLGGIFNGIHTNLGHFDLGMNYVEIFNDNHDDIKFYDPQKRNDFLNYTFYSNKYLIDNFELEAVPVGQSLINGVFYEDYIIFDKLEFLSKIPELHKKIILSQLSFSNENHPSNKYTDPDYLNYSYEYICNKLYGSFFYENYLEPYLIKVLNVNGSEIPALFHRLAWMPLFYPETIKNAINGIFKETKNCFYYPKDGNFNYLVNRLKDKIKNAQNIKIHNKKVSIDLKNRLLLDGKVLNTKKIYFGSNIKNFSKNHYTNKISLILIFVKIDFNNLNRLFSVINVIDKSTPIFRITNQNVNKKKCEFYKLCFEINKDYLNDNFSSINLNNLVADFLLENSIIQNKISSNCIDVKYFNEIIEIPSFRNFSAFNNAKINFKKYNLISPSNSFFSNSLNDQIIESFKISKIINNE